MIRLTLAGCLVLFLFQSADARECAPGAESSLKILSFNLQVKDHFLQVAPWRDRLPKIVDTVKDFEVFGIQEGLSSMLDDLLVALPNFGYIGQGRDDGIRAGEHAAIFFRKDLFEVLDTQTFWLAPDRERPGSIGWDAKCPRVVTWALFKSRTQGKVFYVVNTHFDHIGRKAQAESARLLGSLVKSMGQSHPVIVLGDFNVKPQSHVYNMFVEESEFHDAMTLAPHKGPDWTFSIYNWWRSKIDFIFVSGKVRVCEHQILPEDSSGRRSDHLPVAVTIADELL